MCSQVASSQGSVTLCLRIVDRCRFRRRSRSDSLIRTVFESAPGNADSQGYTRLGRSLGLPGSRKAI